MDVLSVLVNSKKVRIDRHDLEELTKFQEGVRQLIFLLSDRDGFVRDMKVQFPSWTLFESDLAFKTVKNLAPQSVMICKNEVAGPLAFLNISWESVVKILSWPSIIQVEKTQRYTAVKESWNDAESD